MRQERNAGVMSDKKRVFSFPILMFLCASLRRARAFAVGRRSRDVCSVGSLQQMTKRDGLYVGDPTKAGTSYLSRTRPHTTSTSSAVHRTEQMFDEQIWSVYVELAAELRGNARVKKKLAAEDFSDVDDYLMLNGPYLNHSMKLTDSEPLSDLAAEQRARFRNATAFSRAQNEYLARSLSYLGDTCAKRQLYQPVLVAWYKMKESGIIPRENTLSTYMYALGLAVEAEEECLEVATFHDSVFEPNEKTVTLRIKGLVKSENPLAAENVLASLPCKGKEDSNWKRLRTFTPILQYYCDNCETEHILRLFRQMRNSDGVFFDDETYGMIISGLSRCRSFSKDVHLPHTIDQHGFQATDGPALFDELITEMADDVLEISEATAANIVEALSTMCNQENYPSDMFIVDQVEVNATSAKCPKTGVTLQLFSLTDDQRVGVHDTLLDMAAAQHEEFGKKLHAKGRLKNSQDNGQFALDQLNLFSQWLSHREGDPFTAIIDGPNVAYFGHGDVHYDQIEIVLEELERMGENPVVIMPQKYTARKFWLNGLGCNQELSNEEMNIVNELIQRRKMYVTSAGCLDDYYWMLASVAKQGKESVSSEKRTFPGVRPLLITNDQMRDHRLSLLEPRAFRRWTSCHVVNYDISSSEGKGAMSVEFYPPHKFSREIQGKSSKAMNGSTAWYFPVVEWQEPKRLCVCLPC